MFNEIFVTDLFQDLHQHENSLSVFNSYRIACYLIIGNANYEQYAYYVQCYNTYWNCRII